MTNSIIALPREEPSESYKKFQELGFERKCPMRADFVYYSAYLPKLFTKSSALYLRPFESST